jgi:hypothetical protein
VREYDPERPRLVALGRSQTIADPKIAAAWRGFIDAIEYGWLGPRDLDRVIGAVRARESVGNEEFFFDFDPPGSDEVISRFISDEYIVPVDAMVAELERLRRRFRGDPEPEPGPPLGAPESSPADTAESAAPPSTGGGAATTSNDAPDLAGFITGLLGDPALAPGTDALKGRLSEISDAVGRLVSAMQSNDPAQRQRASAEFADLQRRLAEGGTSAAGWTQAQKDEFARALKEARGVNLDRLTQGLRVITRWLEQRSPEAGAAVDLMIEGLEKSFGHLVTPGKKTAEAERDEKVRADARSSIAQRLREAGVKPSGES